MASSSSAAAAKRRVQTLMSHLNVTRLDVVDGGGQQSLQSENVAAVAVRSLPRFDVGVLEAYLDDLRSMKLEVYELLRQHPELLPPTLEGMTKGISHSVASFTVVPFTVSSHIVPVVQFGSSAVSIGLHACHTTQ